MEALTEAQMKVYSKLVEGVRKARENLEATRILQEARPLTYKQKRAKQSISYHKGVLEDLEREFENKKRRCLEAIQLAEDELNAENPAIKRCETLLMMAERKKIEWCSQALGISLTSLPPAAPATGDTLATPPTVSFSQAIFDAQTLKEEQETARLRADAERAVQEREQKERAEQERLAQQARALKAAEEQKTLERQRAQREAELAARPPEPESDVDSDDSDAKLSEAQLRAKWNIQQARKAKAAAALPSAAPPPAKKPVKMARPVIKSVGPGIATYQQPLESD